MVLSPTDIAPLLTRNARRTSLSANQEVTKTQNLSAGFLLVSRLGGGRNLAKSGDRDRFSVPGNEAHPHFSLTAETVLLSWPEEREAPSSSLAQDTRFSSLQQGFKSPWGHQNHPESYRGLGIFLWTVSDTQPDGEKCGRKKKSPSSPCDEGPEAPQLPAPSLSQNDRAVPDYGALRK